jgi:CRISPR-associated protein Cas1
MSILIFRDELPEVTRTMPQIQLTWRYGYGFLEGECRSAINAVGLEPSAGFLHEFSAYQTKQSLVYDLEEPFRWLIDTSVLKLSSQEH